MAVVHPLRPRFVEQEEPPTLGVRAMDNLQFIRQTNGEHVVVFPAGGIKHYRRDGVCGSRFRCTTDYFQAMARSLDWRNYPFARNRGVGHDAEVSRGELHARKLGEADDTRV